MTAPKIDTQAPETIWLHYAAEAIGEKPERWWEYQDYERRDLADARAAAAWIAGRDAAVADVRESWEEGVPPAEFAEWAEQVEPPADPAAALDRLIAERVRVEVEAEREACISVLDDLYRCISCGTTFLTSKGHYDEDCPKNHASWDGASEEQKIAAIRARGSKEGR